MKTEREIIKKPFVAKGSYAVLVSRGQENAHFNAARVVIQKANPGLASRSSDNIVKETLTIFSFKIRRQLVITKIRLADLFFCCTSLIVHLSVVS